MNKEDLQTRILAFDCGALEEQEVMDLFQELINTGVVWTLGKTYSNYAATLLQLGQCRRYG